MPGKPCVGKEPQWGQPGGDRMKSNNLVQRRAWAIHTDACWVLSKRFAKGWGRRFDGQKVECLDWLAEQSLWDERCLALPVGNANVYSIFHFMLVCQNQPNWIVEKVNYYLPQTAGVSPASGQTPGGFWPHLNQSPTLGAFYSSPGLGTTWQPLSYSPEHLRMPWALYVVDKD